ncbi:MAG: two-component system response regulator AtoC [Candidatus Latescibacterota bacterium]|jgi:two-component system response regulator AtoC
MFVVGFLTRFGSCEKVFMRVLIVDDEPGVRGLLSAALEAVGCDQIDLAEDGEQALAKTLEHRYDLVTLDIRMPGMSGLDTLPMIRHVMPRAVIAIISAYTVDAIDVDIGDADLMISKPFELKVVMSLAQLAQELVDIQRAIHALGEE